MVLAFAGSYVCFRFISHPICVFVDRMRHVGAHASCARSHRHPSYVLIQGRLIDALKNNNRENEYLELLAFYCYRIRVHIPAGQTLGELTTD